MKGRDLLSIHDLSVEEVWQILKLADSLKLQAKSGEKQTLLLGKTLAMIFEKPSLRTRVAFETGMLELGGHAIYLSPDDIKLGQRESVTDIARVLSRYVSGIMARTFAHEQVVELARYASVPVINGLTDLLHPCQVLADLATIYEKKGKLSGLKLGYIGDGNNVSHSLMFGAAKVGIDITIATPRGYEPKRAIYNSACEDALSSSSGAKIEIVHEIESAAEDADVLYTDVWASMGQEGELVTRRDAFSGYQLNREVVEQAKPDVIVLHCLPAHRGEEITDEILDDARSAVFDQAENRLHVHKAVLALLL